MSGFKVDKNVVEIESRDPNMRSFYVQGDLGGVRVNVWKTKHVGLFTVGTYMDHPKQGKTQLFRKNCNLEEVMKILKNPRIHTGKGYR